MRYGEPARFAELEVVRRCYPSSVNEAIHPEDTTNVRLWNPMGFFGRPWEEGGLINYALMGLALLAIAAFVVLIIRGRHSSQFLLPLVLSLAPFIFFSLISYLRFYLVLGSAPPSATVNSGGAALASIQYPIQFGMVVSGVLVVIHFCFYVARKARNA